MSKKINLEPLPPPRVEIINLIDVLITLIAFFLLTTVFADQEQRIPINLPSATNVKQSSNEKLKLNLYLTAEDRLYLEDKPIELTKLIDALNKCNQDTLVIIKADRSCRFEQVVQLIDQIKKSKLRKVTFAVNHNQ